MFVLLEIKSPWFLLLFGNAKLRNENARVVEIYWPNMFVEYDQLIEVFDKVSYHPTLLLKGQHQDTKDKGHQILIKIFDKLGSQALVILLTFNLVSSLFIA